MSDSCGTDSENRVVCDVCGKGNARIRQITRVYGKGNDLLLIEDIPVISCPDCGENYLTAETLHKIDQIKRARKQVAVERLIEVAHY